MAGKVCIVGWAHTPFGRLPELDTEALMARVSRSALAHAGVEASDVDCITVGIYNNGFSNQGFEAALVSLGEPALGTCRRPGWKTPAPPAQPRIYTAADFIAEPAVGGSHLSIGAEKMTGVPTRRIRPHLADRLLPRRKKDTAVAALRESSASIARTLFPERMATTPRRSPRSPPRTIATAFRIPSRICARTLGFDFCNTVSDKNPYVAAPLRRTDCSLDLRRRGGPRPGDEETAVADAARDRLPLAPPMFNDILPLSRRDPTEFAGARRPGQERSAAPGITLDDLDFVETHDCFTIAELIEYEAMGLAPRGQGYTRRARGRHGAKGGRLPVNPSGGLKAKGHPLGATGVSMHVMAAMQLMGEAGEHAGARCATRRRLQHGWRRRRQLRLDPGAREMTIDSPGGGRRSVSRPAPARI